MRASWPWPPCQIWPLRPLWPLWPLWRGNPEVCRSAALRPIAVRAVRELAGQRIAGLRRALPHRRARRIGTGSRAEPLATRATAPELAWRTWEIGHVSRQFCAGLAVTAMFAGVPARPVPPLFTAAVTCAPGQFCSAVATLDAPTQAAMTGVTWRRGCPVALRDLRNVTLTYWGFDGHPHEGHLVVHREAAKRMVRVFGELFAAKFPIERMVPIEAYAGDDDASTKANNTSAFNCRPAFGSTKGFSQHAYGRAVDINPVQNPYVRSNGTTLDPLAQRFADRATVIGEPGVITADGPVVRAFTAQGWGWGGRFRTVKDYQHFSSNGR